MAEQKKKGGGGGSILKVLVLGVLLLVGGVLAWGMTLDTNYHWESSVIVDADKDEVHALAGDLKKWDEWGPWRAQYKDDITYQYSESTTAVGDTMSFTTPDGKGQLKWTEIDEDNGVKYWFQWENYHPMTGGVKYEETDDGKVKVTWYADSTETPFIERFIMTLANDTMQEMYDKGTAGLKTKVEADE